MIGEEEIQAVSDTLRHGVLYRHLGNQVSQLEQEFAQRLGIPYVIALNSGTSALGCAFTALGIGPGDEVIVPCYSFIGVAAAVLRSGATPVFCEIDETLTLSVHNAAQLINQRTKAIVAVHMRGAPCDMDALDKLCGDHQISLIEDVSQSCGGSFRGQPLGTFGRIGCFSLQYFKVITTGEGGFLVTREPELFKRSLFEHDASAFWARGEDLPKTYMPLISLNLRMGELEGALGRVQLKKLDTIIEKLRVVKQNLVQMLGNEVGFKKRSFHDYNGEVPIALTLQIDEALPAEEIESAVKALNIPGALLLPPDSSSPNRHFCDGWGKILGADRLIGEHRCQSSRNLLSRTLQIQIDPSYLDKELEEIAKELRTVFKRFTS